MLGTDTFNWLKTAQGPPKEAFNQRAAGDRIVLRAL
jgi:hypothetical protein